MYPAERLVTCTVVFGGLDMPSCNIELLWSIGTILAVRFSWCQQRLL